MVSLLEIMYKARTVAFLDVQILKILGSSTVGFKVANINIIIHYVALHDKYHFGVSNCCYNTGILIKLI